MQLLPCALLALHIASRPGSCPTTAAAAGNQGVRVLGGAKNLKNVRKSSKSKKNFKPPRCQPRQDVRGDRCGLLVCAYHFLTICLPTPHDFFTNCTFAELTTRCEGRSFGVARVCIPFPYTLLTKSLQFAYQLHIRRIDDKM